MFCIINSKRITYDSPKALNRLETLLWTCTLYVSAFDVSMFVHRSARKFLVLHYAWQCVCVCVCVYVDMRCAINNGGCHNNATCASNDGSSTCICNTGYAGNGVICTGKWTNFEYSLSLMILISAIFSVALLMALCSCVWCVVNHLLCFCELSTNYGSLPPCSEYSHAYLRQQI